MTTKTKFKKLSANKNIHKNIKFVKIPQKKIFAEKKLRIKKKEFIYLNKNVSAKIYS